jgi:hypothetical protein
VAITALLGAACGACGTTDDRPRTLEYITETVLAPTCGMAPCHSTFKQEVGDVFDTVDGARLSIVRNGLVDPAHPQESTLYHSITDGVKSRFGTNKVRMPFDAPMPDVDVQLILAWIQDGAHGAQCVPNAQGLGCAVTVVGDAAVYSVVQCPGGNVGAAVMVCTGTQVCTVDTGNGQCK